MTRSNILSNISRTKYLDSSDLQTDLKRCLTTSDLMMIGIGNMVGSGIYVLTGEVSKNLAGPSVFLSYILAGLVSLMAAICYAEFGGRVPRTGSAFIYAYVTIGEIWAFLIGWNLILEYIVAAAAVSTAWSGSLDQLLGHAISNATVEFVMGGKTWDSAILAKYPDFVGFGVICLMMIIVSVGVSFSSVAMNCFVVLNVLIVLVIFILSLTKADFSNFNAGNGFFAFGFSGVISGSATCFFAFVGFDSIALATEEAINPIKSTPVASVVSVIFVIIMYVAASVSLTLMVPYYDIVPEAAFPAALSSVGYRWAEVVVGIGTLIGMSSSLLGSLFALPRSVYAMAIEGLLFPCFASVNKYTRVPVISTVVFGTVSALLALSFELSALVEFLSIGTLMAYAMVAAAVIVIRYQPALHQMNDDSSDNGVNDDSGPGSFVSNPRDKYGTLKEPFRNIPIISSFPPGRAVSVCYFVSVVFQCLSIVSALQVPDFVSKWWAILLAVTFGILAILSFIPILMHNQNEDITTFKTPLVPYFPALSVLLNIMLMAKLQPLTWVRFIVWVFIGLMIYAFYGYHNSQEGKKRSSGGETKDYQRMSNDSSSQDYGAIELRQSSMNTLD